MNWPAQVRHVAAKDAKQGWLPLVVYAVLVVASVVGIVSGQAFGPYSPTPSTEVLGMRESIVNWLPLVTVVLGLVSSAWLVQADSPTKPNAFWASRPLAPSAVLLAKIALMATVIVAIPLIGAGISLASLDTGGDVIARILAKTSLSYIEWALAVMIIGALTDDIRGFAGMFVTIIFANLILVALLDELRPPTGAIAPIALTAIGVVAGVWFLSVIYRTRDRRHRMWVGGAVAAMCLVTASFASPFTIVPNIPATTGAAIHLAPLIRSEIDLNRDIQVAFHVAQDSGFEQTSFEPDSIWFRLDSGKEIHSTVNGRSALVRATVPPLLPDLRWIARDTYTSESRAGISVEVTDAEHDSIAKSVQSVIASGTMTISRARVVASLPLQVGASAIRDGRRIRIYGFSRASRGVEVFVQTSVVPDAQTANRAGSGLQLAIVNDGRKEAMLLERSSSASGGSGMLVLPWVQLYTSFDRRGPTVWQLRDSLRRDEQWYSGARLVVMEWDIVGQYRSRGEAGAEQRRAEAPPRARTTDGESPASPLRKK